MKRFLGYFAASILIVFCLHGLLFISFLVICSNTNNELYTTHLNKWNFAESINKPKLLVIGGSNVKYNFSTEMISKEIEIPSINLGNYAPIIIPYMLDQWIPLVREGDIILLPLEYGVYKQSKAINWDILYYVSKVNVDWLFASYQRFLEALFSCNVENLLIGTCKEFVHLIKPDNVMVFSDKPSEFFDIKGTHPDNMTNGMHNKLSLILNENLPRSPYTYSFSNEAREVLTKFITECHQRKATVVLTYPGTFYYKSYQETAFQDFIVEIGDFARDLGVPIIGTPENFLFSDKGLFWDTNYHLNQRGRDIATERMIALLKDFLKKHSNKSE